MRARLLCVGKPRNRHADALFADYAERINKLGLPFSTASVAEVKSGGRYSDAHVQEREAANLSDALDKGERLIALDPNGRPLKSEELAQRLESWVRPSVAFVIGGPLGLHSELLKRADERWSLGAGTLPHELARVVVAEQIYRACTIQRGLPYHK